MSVPQRKFREIVFQLLYSHDLGGFAEGDMIPFMMEELSVTRATMEQAHRRMQEIHGKLAEIDAIIAKMSLLYDFSRIQRVERNILRLGMYELFYDSEIPPKVAIAEAMRLCRKFSTPEAGHFVNALLDEAYKKSLEQGIEADEGS